MEAEIIQLEQQIDPRDGGKEYSTEPLSPLVQTSNHYLMIVAFVKQQMKKDVDYGVIPNTNNKPVLLKPGAEKLCRLFNLYPQLELVQSITDFDKPLFHYHYKCTIYRHGEPIGEGEGCCNSKEKKYEKQQYKVYDLVNTITKIAQKRAMVSAVLVAVGASEFFTADLEDNIATVLKNPPPSGGTPLENTGRFSASSQSLAGNKLSILIDQTTTEVNRLGWTNAQARLYLQENFNKSNRTLLTETELRLFLEYLRSQK